MFFLFKEDGDGKSRVCRMGVCLDFAEKGTVREGIWVYIFYSSLLWLLTFSIPSLCFFFFFFARIGWEI